MFAKLSSIHRKEAEMPNWCETTYKCVGEEEEIKSLHEILETIRHRKDPKTPNGFGHLWLGELVTELGFNWEKLSCRGEIINFELYDGVLSIWQDTAWCEQEGVRYAIQKKFPSIKVYYLEEEPGCEVYQTNDLDGTYFPYNYYLDCYDDPQYFETIEQAAKYVEDLVGHEVEANTKSITKALDDYAEIRQENDEDVFYCFHEFQRIEN